jgi:hypothetical protein
LLVFKALTKHPELFGAETTKLGYSISPDGTIEYAPISATWEKHKQVRNLQERARKNPYDERIWMEYSDALEKYGRYNESLWAKWRATAYFKDVPQVSDDPLEMMLDIGQIFDRSLLDIYSAHGFLQDCRKQEENSLYKAANEYLPDGEIVIRRILDESALKKEAGAELLKRSGNLSARDFRNAKELDVLSDIIKSAISSEALVAKVYSQGSDVVSEFKLAIDENRDEAGQALAICIDLGILDEATIDKIRKIMSET